MARRRPGPPDAPTPAVAALRRAGVEHTVHRYPHDPAAGSFGDEAVTALGQPATRVFKTLIATSGTVLVVGVVPVSATVDLKALARALGQKSLRMAEVADAERSSGYVAGGISPLGQRVRLPTVVDTSATDWPTVFVSAGRRGLEVELSAADLVRVLDARIAPVARVDRG